MPGTAWIEGDHWFPGPTPIINNKIEVFYDDPTWDSSYIGTISPTEGFIVQWYLGGQLVQTDTDVYLDVPSRPLKNSTFEVIEEYWNRDLFVIISHPDFYGVRSNSLRICKAIEYVGIPTNDWDDFINNTNGFGWEGNSFIITTTSVASLPYHSPVTPIGSINDQFNGYLDGNGCTVQLDPAMASLGVEYAGLFAYTGPRGTVMNLEITGSVDSTFSSGNCYVGAVAGKNEGTIMNIAYTDTSTGGVYSRGTNSSYVGGITGKNSKTINHCVILGGVIDLNNSSSDGAGRIWGTGNETGRANYANKDNPWALELIYYPPPGSPIQFIVDYTDDRADSKHGKGVEYTLGTLSPSDAGSENWWMYTAGWDAVWDESGLTPPIPKPKNFDKAWHSQTTFLWPVLWWQP